MLWSGYFLKNHKIKRYIPYDIEEFSYNSALLSPGLCSVYPILFHCLLLSNQIRPQCSIHEIREKNKHYAICNNGKLNSHVKLLWPKYATGSWSQGFVNLNYSSQILGSSTLTSYCTMPPLLHTCQFPFGPVKSIMLTSVTLVAMGPYIVIRVKLRDLVCWLSYREATTGLGSIAVPMHGHFDFDTIIHLFPWTQIWFVKGICLCQCTCCPAVNCHCCRVMSPCPAPSPVGNFDIDTTMNTQHKPHYRTSVNGEGFAIKPFSLNVKNRHLHQILLSQYRCINWVTLFSCRWCLGELFHSMSFLYFP